MLLAVLALPSEASDFLVTKARSLSAKGKYSVAAALLTKAIAAEPGSPAPHLAMGDVLRDAGYYFLDNDFFDGASQAYDAALAIDPALPEARFRRTVLFYEAGSFKEALEGFEQLLASSDGEDMPLLQEYRDAAWWGSLVREKGAEALEKEGTRRCRHCRDPIEGDFFTLEDGKVICESCFGDALNDPDKFKEIYKNVTGVIAEEIGLDIVKPASAHLVSGEELSRIAGEDFKGLAGVEAKHLAGLFSSHQGKPALFILRGMPRFEAIRVIAHEYAHAWVRENCPPDIALKVNEGFSEWVAFQVMHRLDEPEEAGKMFLQLGPYGVNFKRMEVYSRVLGNKELINLVREGKL